MLSKSSFCSCILEPKKYLSTVIVNLSTLTILTLLNSQSIPSKMLFQWLHRMSELHLVGNNFLVLWWICHYYWSVLLCNINYHQVFFDFARIFSLFSFAFGTANFWSLRNLIKELFHSRLLDMRLVIANIIVNVIIFLTHSWWCNHYLIQDALFRFFQIILRKFLLMWIIFFIT